MNKVKPNFEKGGKLEKFYPAFNAFETFLFVPEHTAPPNGAHIRDAIDLKRTMILVVLSLVPCLLFGIWNVGYQHYKALGIMDASFIDNFMFGAKKVLPIVIVSYVTGLTVEFVFAIIRKHTINEGFLVSGMLIPLVMPVDVPLWMVAVSTIFAVIIGKEVFGGTGMNILNPALTARAFLFFAYPTKMSGNEVWINTDLEKGQKVVDGFSGATPLGDAASGFATEIPGMWSSFIGTIPGSIGETSTLACLIGAAILLYTGIGSWRIMLLSLAVIGLGPYQAQNVKLEKMQDILKSIGISSESREAEKIFNQYIQEQIVLNYKGEKVAGQVSAFDIDLKKELDKAKTGKEKEQLFPLFVFKKDDKLYYSIPVRGKGLWGPIWGYIALEADMNTVYGASFGHKGETPGLGAEINTLEFQQQFVGKKIFDESGNFVSVKVIKGGASPEDAHGVDAISGGTITSNGVTEMLKRTVGNYLNYFKSVKDTTSNNY